MDTPTNIVVELSRSEAIALSWLIDLGEQSTQQRVLFEKERIKFHAALNAADKLADAMDDNNVRCVTVGQLVDLVRLVQQDRNSEAHWLLAKIING